LAPVGVIVAPSVVLPPSVAALQLSQFPNGSLPA